MSEGGAPELLARLVPILRDEPEQFASTVRDLPRDPTPSTRDDILIALHALRNQSRTAGDTRREELVLDMLDWVVGWCSPGSQPFG